MNEWKLNECMKMKWINENEMYENEMNKWKWNEWK